MLRCGMLSIHEQIASDQYWIGPVVPPPEDISFANRTRDVAGARSILRGIDRAYRELSAEQQICVHPLQPGEELSVNIAGGLLKIVTDMRVQPKQESKRHTHLPVDLFDTQAQSMTDTLLFTGGQSRTRINGSDNSFVDIVRKTAYLRNSTSQRQLVGKSSELLDKGGSEHNAIYMRRQPVGHIESYETRKNIVQARIVSAEVIALTRPKRGKKIFDLKGAMRDWSSSQLRANSAT